MWVTGEPGELLVGLDDEPVHVVQLAEQADSGAVRAEFEADEPIGAVGQVDHLDSAHGLGVGS